MHAGVAARKVLDAAEDARSVVEPGPFEVHHLTANGFKLTLNLACVSLQPGELGAGEEAGHVKIPIAVKRVAIGDQGGRGTTGGSAACGSIRRQDAGEEEKREEGGEAGGRGTGVFDIAFLLTCWESTFSTLFFSSFFGGLQALGGSSFFVS